MKKTLLLVMLPVILMGCSTSPTTEGVKNQNTGSVNTIQTYTIQDVQENSTPDSCRTIIENNVYDLTKWISKHPGGDKNIEKLCGIDGTKMFQNKHGGKENPEKVLETFKIGSIQ